MFKSSQGVLRMFLTSICICVGRMGKIRAKNIPSGPLWGVKDFVEYCGCLVHGGYIQMEKICVIKKKNKKYWIYKVAFIHSHNFYCNINNIYIHKYLCQAKISITQSFERSEILEKRGGPNGPKLDLNRMVNINLEARQNHREMCANPPSLS